jgi:hypothetical protein
LDSGDGKRVLDAHAAEPVSQLAGPPRQRLVAVASDVFQQPQLHSAVGVLGPAADHLTVPPGGGSGVAIAVENPAAVPAQIPVSVVPTHRGDVQARQQCAPRVGLRLLLEVVG